MNTSEIFDRLRGCLPQAIVGVQLEAIDPWIEVTPDGLPDVCRQLRDDVELAFNMLHLVSAVDFFQPDAKLAEKTEWKPHTEVVYHLSSLTKRHRVVLKVSLPRWKDDIEGQLPELPSVSGIWRTADWHEREVFDLSGVRFIGHPELRRILCPEDWVGHPLRKDYQMPTEYHGIRAR
jgi:NADH-quinone oxidoreductase subunit C